MRGIASISNWRRKIRRLGIQQNLGDSTSILLIDEKSTNHFSSHWRQLAWPANRSRDIYGNSARAGREHVYKRVTARGFSYQSADQIGWTHSRTRCSSLQVRTSWVQFHDHSCPWSCLASRLPQDTPTKEPWRDHFVKLEYLKNDFMTSSATGCCQLGIASYHGGMPPCSYEKWELFLVPLRCKFYSPRSSIERKIVRSLSSNKFSRGDSLYPVRKENTTTSKRCRFDVECRQRVDFRTTF